MLTHLSVRDYVLVERLELDLGPGMTSLTGETGAGKSILVDALGLALGARASGEMTRHDRERAEVTATFELPAVSPVLAWLDKNGLADEGACLLRRSVTRDGRSRAFINDRPVTVQSLRALGEQLVEVHGQHAQQALVARETQRRLLDEFGGHTELLARMATTYDALHRSERELERLRGGSRDVSSRIELLRYQVDELVRLAPGEGELEALDEEHRRLSRADELLQTCAGAMEAIAGEEGASAVHALSQSLRALDTFAAGDRRLEEVRALLETALINAEEAAGELRAFVDGFEADPMRLREVETRLDALHQVARKHHVRTAELSALLARLREELGTLESAELRVATLERERHALRERYAETATVLHDERCRAGAALAASVVTGLRRLGMEQAVFEVMVEAAPALESPSGHDRVEFMVSSNTGVPLQPLSRVASGGELSRISLVIETATVAGSGIPTLVFDEVDTGIGGRIAEIVGHEMRSLARHRQVLCVTHLPQVAALADRHLQVRKRVNDDTTVAELAPLAGEERVQEVARMLGGLRVTARTIEHAREMLDG